MFKSQFQNRTLNIGQYARQHHIPKANRTVSVAALIDEKRDLYVNSKNYQNISSLVYKVRFAPQMPVKKHRGFSEQIGINKKVLNDYVNIVNRRKYLVDQIEDNFEEMKIVQDKTIRYFDKYVLQGDGVQLSQKFSEMSPGLRFALKSFNQSESIISKKVHAIHDGNNNFRNNSNSPEGDQNASHGGAGIGGAKSTSPNNNNNNKNRSHSPSRKDQDDDQERTIQYISNSFVDFIMSQKQLQLYQGLTQVEIDNMRSLVETQCRHYGKQRIKVNLFQIDMKEKLREIEEEDRKRDQEQLERLKQIEQEKKKKEKMKLLRQGSMFQMEYFQIPQKTVTSSTMFYMPHAHDQETITGQKSDYNPIQKTISMIQRLFSPGMDTATKPRQKLLSPIKKQEDAHNNSQSRISEENLKKWPDLKNLKQENNKLISKKLNKTATTSQFRSTVASSNIIPSPTGSFHNANEQIKGQFDEIQSSDDQDDDDDDDDDETQWQKRLERKNRKQRLEKLKKSRQNQELVNQFYFQKFHQSSDPNGLVKPYMQIEFDKFEREKEKEQEKEKEKSYHKQSMMSSKSSTTNFKSPKRRSLVDQSIDLEKGITSPKISKCITNEQIDVNDQIQRALDVQQDQLNHQMQKQLTQNKSMTVVEYRKIAKKYNKSLGTIDNFKFGEKNNGINDKTSFDEILLRARQTDENIKGLQHLNQLQKYKLNHIGDFEGLQKLIFKPKIIDPNQKEIKKKLYVYDRTINQKDKIHMNKVLDKEKSYYYQANNKNGNKVNTSESNQF